MHVATDRKLIALPYGGNGASGVARVAECGCHRSPWRLPRALERIEAHKQPRYAHCLDHLRYSAVVVEVRVRHDDRVDASHAKRMQRRHHCAATECGRSEGASIEENGGVT